LARLSVRMLGPLQIVLDEEPATGFASDKVRALLAYLAMETGQPHRREKLAGLLWPDWLEPSARANLRRALANLRQVIGDHQATPPYLHISRQTVQFNTASDAWIDVTAFTGLLQARVPSPETVRQWEQAVELYRGDFLEGFSIADSPAFDEWVSLNREWLRRLVTEALHRLAAWHEQAAQYERGLEHAWRQVEMDPCREQAHRQVMRLLALSGQRSAALTQYETCRRLLAEQLDVEPATETTNLYEQIRSGRLQTQAPDPPSLPDHVASLPPFLEEEAPHVEMPTFVAREQELVQLDRFLDLALTGQGRVVFVTGEAGSGKTALVQEFTRRAQEENPELVAVGGNCNAYTGIGDPYLPWREILGLLTGDVQAQWAAGAMTGEHARHLWDTLPLTAQALVEAGPELIGTFVPPDALLERAVAATQQPERAAWLARLRALWEGQARGPTTTSPKQSDLFEQYTRVLHTLARQVPLVLVVDDLQWADLGSISLLFHLGRQLAGSRILLVGTYRPEEVALERDSDRHPLEAVVHELRRRFGDLAVNLDRAGRREFVEAVLDSEPNRLGVPFRQMLYRQTRGHPLSTIELLRGMQERGDLVQDREGRWVEGPALDWETLPARVEAAIAERIGRLAEPLQAALRVASVEGEDFTAEVVARVLDTDRRKMVHHLSNELDRRHRLVRAQAIERLGSRRVSRYRFRHYLFQKYLYDTLDEVERAYLHEDVGNALEELYSVQAGERAAIATPTTAIGHVAVTAATAATAALAVQLAWHFQEAGIPEKAIHYLHQAGERAVQLSAKEEGIEHLTRALELLLALPDSGDEKGRLERAGQELGLQLSLGRAYMTTDRTVTRMAKAYTRARELCHQMGRMSELSGILGQLATTHYVRAEHGRALELAEEAFSLAQQTGDPLLVALGHWRLAYVLFALGEFTEAQAHLEPMLAFYKPQYHHPLVLLSGSDAGASALAYDACCLWLLGYPEQALQKSEEAFALARALDHPFSLVEIVFFAGCLLSSMRRDAQAVKHDAEELTRLASEKLMPTWLGLGARYRGEALAILGQVQEGMAQMREGMAIDQSTGVGVYLSATLGALAEAQARASNAEEGLATLAEALGVVERTDERCWEAELHRLRGQLLLMQGDPAQAAASLHDAERSFGRAIEVARRQQAKSWELRATTSLARLWQAQGRVDEAREALAEIYGWFTEGFDTPDLQAAKALLDELA
jgi:DNA-binding SARP family transcriptional activator/predicted ATPase